jgi:mycofactocin precursor peptide peptidase
VPELASARWTEIDAAPRRVLVVPLGSLEQHGPHLPLDTDTRIAAAVAARACAGLPGAGLAPPVAIGASGEHADFPGTLSIGTAALTTVLVELGRHASRHWPATLLVNGHGGNVPAIRAALSQLRSEGRECHVWHAGLPESAPGVAADAHAGRFETSLMLALAPDDVRLDRAAPGDTRPLAELMPDLAARGVRAVSPGGVLGDPAGACPGEGERLMERLVAGLRETLNQFLSRTDRPRLRIIRRLDSLGPGRPEMGRASRGLRKGAGDGAAACGRAGGIAPAATHRGGNDPG